MSKPVKIQPTYQLKTHISENKRTRRKSREWWSNGVRLRVFVFILQTVTDVAIFIRGKTRFFCIQT